MVTNRILSKVIVTFNLKDYLRILLLKEIKEKQKRKIII